MYTKDKTLRITFRCEPKLGEWILSQSEMLGITPSAYVRQNLFGLMANQIKLGTLIEQSARSMSEHIISSEKAVSDDEHHIISQ
jgi:hypothetical protein